MSNAILEFYRKDHVDATIAIQITGSLLHFVPIGWHEFIDGFAMRR